jgi:hypothetical protein
MAGRPRLTGVVVPLLMLVAPGRAAAQQPADTAPGPAIVELRLGRLVARTVLAYRVGDDALIPLSQFLSLAEIHAEVDSGGLVRALIEPRHVPFVVDATSRTATFGRRSLTLAAGQLQRDPAELYLSAQVLGELLDLDVIVDWSALEVVVRNPDRLPLALRLQREAARASLLRESPELLPSLVLGSERRPLDGFVLDYSLFSPSSDVFGGASYSLAGGADVAGGSLELGLRSEGPASSGDVRVDGSWLGVWRNQRWLRQVRIGDGLGSGQTPRSIRGLYITNAPYLRPSLISDIAYAGHLPPGWQLEAYRNGVLVGVDSVRADGKYSVELPVLYGENPVDFVAYGPYGERREFSRKYLVPSALLPAGRMEYGVSGGECRFDMCDAAANVDLRAGVSRTWTAGAGVDQFWRDSAPDLFHPYLNAIGNLAGAWTVEASAVLHGYGRARFSYEPTLDLRLGTEATFFSHGGDSPILNPLNRRSQFQANAFWRPDSRRNYLYVDGRLEYATTDGGSTLRSRLGISVDLAGVRAVPYLRLDRTAVTGAGAETDNYFGLDAFAVPNGHWGALFRRLWFRGSLEARGAGTLNYASFSIARTLSPALRLESGVSWTRGSGGATWTMALSTALPQLRAFTQVTAPADGPVSGTQYVQGSLLYDKAEGSVALDAGPSLQRGGLAGVVFLDRDGNGRRDEGEPGLGGVRVQVGNSSDFSDSTGAYRVWDVVPFEPVLVTVDSLSFESPLWVPGFEAAVAYPAPNAITRVDVPLQLGAVIEGVVQRGPAAEPVAGVPLQLTELRTGHRRTLSTFSDGTFYSMGITPGEWELSVAPATLQLLDAVSEPVRFTVPRGATEVPRIVVWIASRP